MLFLQYILLNSARDVLLQNFLRIWNSKDIKRVETVMTYIPLEFMILNFLRCQIVIKGFLNGIDYAVVVGLLVELEREDIF